MNLPGKTSGPSCLAFAAAITATSIACSSPALAGEPPIVAPSWTGFYVGVHGGWGWGTTEIQDPIFQPAFNPTEVKYNGPLAGGQIGGNWQIGNFVLGAEVDGSWAFVRGNSSRNGVITSSTRDAFGYKSLATGAGRVGYTMGQWLAYAKGGVAWADMEVTTGSISVNPVTYESSLVGAVGGAGFEVAFLRNVSAKFEYNFLYFPTDHFSFVTNVSTSNIDHVVQMVKGGINVRFGG
jgi:outer membrane immunogenic protein